MTGWMPDVERAETAAQGGYSVEDGEMKATAVVIHVIEGWLTTMIEWARERPVHHQASYHFVVGLSGAVTQFVPIFTPAWHAGRRDDGTPPTWSGWDPPRNPGGHTVAIAREGFASHDWAPVQIRATVEVCKWVMARHGIIPAVENLIGHYELNPVSRAHDPGGDWDKLEMIAAIIGDPVGGRSDEEVARAAELIRGAELKLAAARGLLER